MLQAHRPKQHHPYTREGHRPSNQSHPLLCQDGCSPLKAHRPPSNQAHPSYPGPGQGLSLPQSPSWKEAHKFPRWQIQEPQNRWMDRHNQEPQDPSPQNPMTQHPITRCTHKAASSLNTTSNTNTPTSPNTTTSPNTPTSPKTHCPQTRITKTHCPQTRIL